MTQEASDSPVLLGLMLQMGVEMAGNMESSGQHWAFFISEALLRHGIAGKVKYIKSKDTVSICFGGGFYSYSNWKCGFSYSFEENNTHTTNNLESSKSMSLLIYHSDMSQ